MKKEDSEKKLGNIIKVPISYHVVKIKDYDIHYIVAGKGKPLVLIHGGNIGWGHWYPNIAELSKHFTVYALDLPGGGRSTKINFKNLHLEKDLVGVVDLFIKRLNLQEVSILGTSMGGWIVMRVALLNPELIKKLIVVDSVGFSNKTVFSDKIMSFYPLAKLISKTILKPDKKNIRLEKFLRGVFYDSSIYIPPEFIEYFYDTMKQSHNLLYISRLSNSKAREQTYLINDLKNIQCETLILWGDHDKFMPLNDNKDTFKLIGNVRSLVIKNAGHIPSIEKAEIFNKTVIKFIG